MQYRKNMVFDVDGTLVEADDKVRIEKYKVLFKDAMKLVKSQDYDGCAWLFAKLKTMYDDGVTIKPKYYKLINKNTGKILAKLSERYELYATSWASKEITLEKLKATGIDKYFIDVIRFKDSKKVIVVDDRPKSFKNAYFVKFEYGQYKGSECKADKYINTLEDLLDE